MHRKGAKARRKTRRKQECFSVFCSSSFALSRLRGACVFETNLAKKTRNYRISMKSRIGRQKIRPFGSTLRTGLGVKIVVMKQARIGALVLNHGTFTHNRVKQPPPVG